MVYHSKFGLGDSVCIRVDAEQGKLSTGTIKKISFEKDIPLYSLNNRQRIFLEREIVSEEEGIELAMQYHRRQLEWLERIKRGDEDDES